RPFSSDIAEMVRETLGAEIEVLDGLREAELGFQAVIGSTGANGPGPAPVTIGIGYGSTEFATIGADGRLLRMSLPIGASTVTEHYLAGDPPRAEELSAALSVIELYLDDLRREQPDLAAALAQGRAEVVGLGAIRFIAEVELGRNEGDEIEGYQLTCTATEEVFRALATESAGERTANPGLRPEHVDGIVGAMCVLVETMRQFGIAALRVSTAGLLDGLAAVRTVGPVGHGQTSQSGGPSGSGTVH
ncbi:MAG: hypothetical protein OER95_01855, partial [Acidimicrobiia bacterium]|nr:hypothetical protein [Acidimicrobiia bacterium]